MKLPKGWKLKKENGKQIVYESEKYQIIIWKKRGDYLVETFRKSPTYRARLFAQSFLKLREAKKFAVDIMGRDKIRKY
ncbi:MAG TPA: hypothetical protein ENF51_00210 [Candidatus Aenigmarchaeota archaeon]|nr:hypothetical protein [Candidatus Aenigmarchaeota archaeon]